MKGSRRETDTTIMARVIELVYFSKIVNVFVAHDACRVGGHEEETNTDDAKLEESSGKARALMFEESVPKDSSNNVNVCGGNVGFMFVKIFASVHYRDQAVVRAWEEEERRETRATTTQKLCAEAVERTARVTAARHREMTFRISSMHREAKNCTLACCRLPRASISAVSLTNRTAAGCGRPYMKPLVVI